MAVEATSPSRPIADRRNAGGHRNQSKPEKTNARKLLLRLINIKFDDVVFAMLVAAVHAAVLG